MARATVAHTLHDIGLAAWFGGTLMGAVGVNGAAADVHDPKERSRVANAGWARWTPVNAAAIGLHLVGGAIILSDHKGRIAGQKGVAGWTLAKLSVTGVALAATAYSGLLGRKLQKAGDFPAEGGTSPSAQTPPDLAGAQRQLSALQWAIPAFTGGILVANAVMQQQQRPTEVAKGSVARLSQAASHPQAALAALKGAVTS